MKDIVILGIDPGFHVTGYAIIKKEDSKTFLLDLGYFQLNYKDHLSSRIGEFYNFFLNYIEKYKVTHLSIETPFLGKNVQSFLKLGYLRGILYLLANQHKIAIAEFSPREIKFSITGFGGATKDQVASAISRIFPKLADITKSAKNDVSDALAICICGLWQNKNL